MDGFSFKSLLIGLAIGLVVALSAYFAEISKRQRQKKEYEKETAKLREMLSDRMDLESAGLAQLKVELENLRKENENLRVSLASMSQKPGRKEVERLQVYQTALDRLMISSPGFGAAWQQSLQEAEAENEKVYSGKLAFMRKAAVSSKTAAAAADAEEVK